jgi:hypothetical protein
MNIAMLMAHGSAAFRWLAESMLHRNIDQVFWEEL